MAVDDLINQEYDYLTKEIQENAAKVFQILTFCVAGTTGLLSYIVTADPNKLPYGKAIMPFLLLIPLLIILPSVRLVIASLHSTARIAAYLRVFYENESSKVRWQSAIQKYRKMNAHERKKRPFAAALKTIFWSLSVCCVSASVAYFYDVYRLLAPGRRWAFLLAYTIALVVPVAMLIREFMLLGKEWGFESFDEERRIWIEYRGTIDAVSTSPAQSEQAVK